MPLDLFMEFACPNCSQPLDIDEKRCPACGINLALAVVLAERSLISVSAASSGPPISPEILVPRLGATLLEKGMLAQEDLNKALDFQAQAASSGKPKLLGQALLELGLVDREVLDQAITEQIFQLHAALAESNQKLERRVQERTLELQTALHKLTELNQLKSSFISSISHELRTPLTHIKGYLDLLVEGDLGPLNLAQSEVVEVLQRAEQRLEQLIEDLIRFSLASKGELSLSMTPFNVNEIVKDAVERVSDDARRKNIEIEVVLADGQPVVVADIEKISWVLLHLLDNAVKFTPEGGRVKLEASTDGKLVTLAVRDTGIGIPDARIAEIFEPFHQLDAADNRRYGGTGLGLALVKSIVEAHASSIKVRSQEGQGSRFEFSLPITQSVYV